MIEKPREGLEVGTDCIAWSHREGGSIIALYPLIKHLNERPSIVQCHRSLYHNFIGVDWVPYVCIDFLMTARQVPT